jgi:hypothetical protein
VSMEDEVKPVAGSPEHELQRRGGVAMEKNGSDLSSLRERRRARESSRVRGRGVGRAWGARELL